MTHSHQAWFDMTYYNLWQKSVIYNSDWRETIHGTCKSPDRVTVLSVTSLQSSFLDLVFCDRRAAYFSVLLHLFAKGGAQEICPSLRTMLSLVRLLWCFYFGRLVFIPVPGPLYINEKVRFSIYWESFFKGWPLCLPFHPHRMLQTNIYVYSRLLVDVCNCDPSYSSSGLFQDQMRNVQKWKRPLYLCSEFSF